MLRISTWRFYHMHFACWSCWYMIIVPDAYSIFQVLVHDDYIPNAQLHVTCVNTCWLYHLHNCMLQDWYNNISNSDCEHGISYYSTYRSRLCFSDIDCFCMDFVSSRFCWVICSLSFYPCQCISWVCGFHNLQSFAIVWLQLYLRLELGPTYLSIWL